MRLSAPQNFANHRRLIPPYHFGIFGILVLYFIYSIVGLARAPSFPALMGLLESLALLGIFYYARTFALTVQDRVIRLEMRLRLRETLPADLKGRIGELNRDQLIALRFAGDDELPDLVREVLTNKISNRDDIKRRIKKWEPDHLRC